MARPSLYKIVLATFAAVAAGTLAQAAEISPLEVGVTTSLRNMSSPQVQQAHPSKSPGILRNKLFLFLSGILLAAFFAVQCLKFLKSAPVPPAEMKTLPEEQPRPYPGEPNPNLRFIGGVPFRVSDSGEIIEPLVGVFMNRSHYTLPWLHWHHRETVPFQIGHGHSQRWILIDRLAARPFRAVLAELADKAGFPVAHDEPEDEELLAKLKDEVLPLPWNSPSPPNYPFLQAIDGIPFDINPHTGELEEACLAVEDGKIILRTGKRSGRTVLAVLQEAEGTLVDNRGRSIEQIIRDAESQGPPPEFRLMSPDEEAQAERELAHGIYEENSRTNDSRNKGTTN
uniref:Uncharacterized protein n=1 Tax=Eimeria tenella TaxID=5802 RepID=H9B9Y6_EIMTE|nr:hypothetical protein [Eimeria tenella]